MPINATSTSMHDQIAYQLQSHLIKHFKIKIGTKHANRCTREICNYAIHCNLYAYKAYQHDVVTQPLSFVYDQPLNQMVKRYFTKYEIMITDHDLPAYRQLCDQTRHKLVNLYRKIMAETPDMYDWRHCYHILGQSNIGMAGISVQYGPWMIEFIETVFAWQIQVVSQFITHYDYQHDQIANLFEDYLDWELELDFLEFIEINQWKYECEQSTDIIKIFDHTHQYMMAFMESLKPQIKQRHLNGYQQIIHQLDQQMQKQKAKWVKVGTSAMKRPGYLKSRYNALNYKTHHAYFQLCAESKELDSVMKDFRKLLTQ